MKILQLGNIDTYGNRFNGTDLHKELLNRGVDSQHCVWEKNTDNEQTWLLAEFPYRTRLKNVISRLEYQLSVQSILYPFSWSLLLDKRYRYVDLVHYHLIHVGFFNLLSLPFLTRIKPSVWTLHDPWAMTGHCVHPFACEKWITGCGNCPDMNTLFKMERDHTALMWRIKKLVYSLSQIDIVVGSQWMMNMAKQSPLLSNFKLHHIPFGLDLTIFRPKDSELAKRKLGVLPGNLVITFRAVRDDFKGFAFIEECLNKLKPNYPICLLTFNFQGLLEKFQGKYQVIDLGWIQDEELLVDAYNASDIFLMPSMAEAFGMMAMEAMACGKPVIAFEGTSLEEVIFAPHGGIVVRKGDSDALLSVIERLIASPEERTNLGGTALELVKEHYNVKTQINRLLDLYNNVIERRNFLM